MAIKPYPHSRAYEDATTSLQAKIPFGSDGSISSPQFRNMGFNGQPGTSGVTFSRGWELTAPTTSSLCNLFAMFNGSLKYDTVSGELTLTVIDPVLNEAIKHAKPAWSVYPDAIVYGGIDANDLRRTLESMGISWWENFESWTTMVDELLNGTGTLPIRAGSQLVDINGTSSPGSRTYTVCGKFNSLGVSSLDAGLSSFVETYRELFLELETHSLKSLLIDVSWPAWSGGDFRYVMETHPNTVTAANHGGPVSGYFKDPNKPARDLKEAIQYANPYDTVIVLDTAIYTEGEITIDKPLVLMSTAGLNPRDNAFASNQLPQIRPSGGSGRVILVKDVGDEPVGIFQLTVEGGVTTTSTIPKEIGGAGIGVLDSQRVRIERCCIRGNTTSTNILGSSDFLAKIDVLIGGLPSGAKKDLVTLIRARIVASGTNTTYPNYPVSGQSFGAGVCFGWSCGFIRQCLIEDNIVGGRGGGIGVVGYGWPVIEHNTITNNGPNTSGRRDGGGIALEICLPDKQNRDHTYETLMDKFIDYLNNMGPIDVASFLATWLASVIINIDQLANYMAPLSQAFVQGIKWELFDEVRVKKGQNSFVYISNNQIDNNLATDDGGGIYASVMSRFALQSNTIEFNTAGGGGGGVRASMGSDLSIQKDTIIENTSNAFPGGGGVSMRNVHCQVRSTATDKTIIRNNSSTGWAGGGLTLSAVSEGSIGPEGTEMWQAILIKVFEFGDVTLDVKKNCEIKTNQANHVGHGIGGGIYILRGTAVGVRDIDIDYEDYTINVTGNVANEPTSQNARIVDLDEGVDTGDGDPGFSTHLNNQDLDYDSFII